MVDFLSGGSYKPKKANPHFQGPTKCFIFTKQIGQDHNTQVHKFRKKIYFPWEPDQWWNIESGRLGPNKQALQ